MNLSDDNNEHFIVKSSIPLEGISWIYSQEAAEQFAREIVGRTISVPDDSSFYGAVISSELDYENKVIHIVGDIKRT